MIDPSATIAPSAVCATIGGRPMRHAAVMAANRTAAFARTGAFPAEDGEGAGARGSFRSQQQQAALSGGSSDANDSSSDSAEDELLFHGAAGGVGVVGSPIMACGGSGAALLSSGSGSMELTRMMGGNVTAVTGGDPKGDTGLAVDVKMALGVDRAGALTPASADLSALGLTSAHQSTDDLFHMAADTTKVSNMENGQELQE